MGIFLPLFIIFICCLLIWKASDGFETASNYIGRNLSDGVRGATINAIASSMPELFTSLFFLFFLKDAQGFSGGIGTTAGSAVFNSMIIPALVGLTVVLVGIKKRFKVSRNVLRRDGIMLLVTETVFLFLLGGALLDWYHGLVLMLMYLFYLGYMLNLVRKGRSERLKNEALQPQKAIEEEVEEEMEEENTKASPSLIKSLLVVDLEELIIGRKKMNDGNSWALLVTSTLIIALVCMVLVQACEWLGMKEYEVPYLGTFQGLNMPLMFVALILASAASSVPDTIISMKDAQRGNYDDAVSNALGSNIFDLCFALGFPLFLYTLIYGPITMPMEIAELSRELRFFLLLVTIIAVIIFLYGKYMTLIKSYLLFGLYLLFMLYIIGRSYGNNLADSISVFILQITDYLLVR